MSHSLLSKLADEEWRAWQEVCRLLKENGAITQTDCEARAGSIDSPGCKLINAINAWGRRLVDYKREV
jgi:hypothetical protein